MRLIIYNICLILTHIAYANASGTECCAGQPLPANKKCCADVQYDDSPGAAESATLDLSAIANIVSGAFDSYDCGLILPGDNLSLTYTKETVDLCCEGTVTTKYKYTGTVSIGGLGLFCDIPLVGVPNMAEAGITVTMGIGIEGSVDNSPGCDDGDICISISAPVTITGGGYGQVLNGVIDVRIVGGGTGSGSFNYCIVGGFSTGQVCAKPTATFSFEFASIAGASWTFDGEESCS